MSNLIKPNPNLTIVPSTKNLPKPFQKDIFLFFTHIAGTSYIEDIEEIMDQTNEGDEVLFFRETNNIHDSFAICIKNKKKEKLGYIPRVDNTVFARLMDAGKNLVGKIASIEQYGDWYKIDIQIFLRDG